MGLSNKNRALDSCILRMRHEWIDGLRNMFARELARAACGRTIRFRYAKYE